MATIHISDALLQRFKRYVKEKGLKMQFLTEEIISDYLDKAEKKNK